MGGCVFKLDAFTWQFGTKLARRLLFREALGGNKGSPFSDLVRAVRAMAYFLFLREFGGLKKINLKDSCFPIMQRDFPYCTVSV